MEEIILDIKHLKSFENSKVGLDIEHFTHEKASVQAIIGDVYSGRKALLDAIDKIFESKKYNLSGQITFKGIEIEDLSKREYRKFVLEQITFIKEDLRHSFGAYRKVRNILQKNTHHKQNLIKSLLKDFYLADHILEQRYREVSQVDKIKLHLFLYFLNPSELLLVQEPFEFCDIVSRMEILQIMNQLQTEFEYSIIFSASDIRTAYEVADKVSLMANGKIEQVDKFN